MEAGGWLQAEKWALAPSLNRRLGSHFGRREENINKSFLLLGIESDYAVAYFAS
jgi:hypothetical protein